MGLSRRRPDPGPVVPAPEAAEVALLRSRLAEAQARVNTALTVHRANRRVVDDLLDILNALGPVGGRRG